MENTTITTVMLSTLLNTTHTDIMQKVLKFMVDNDYDVRTFKSSYKPPRKNMSYPMYILPKEVVVKWARKTLKSDMAEKVFDYFKVHVQQQQQQTQTVITQTVTVNSTVAKPKYDTLLNLLSINNSPLTVQTFYLILSTFGYYNIKTKQLTSKSSKYGFVNAEQTNMFMCASFDELLNNVTHRNNWLTQPTEETIDFLFSLDVDNA